MKSASTAVPQPIFSTLHLSTETDNCQSFAQSAIMTPMADIDLKAAAVDGTDRRTDVRTDTQPLRRPRTAYYAGSAFRETACEETSSEITAVRKFTQS